MGRPIPQDVPYLEPGAAPPGGWTEHAPGSQLRHWSGEMLWLTRHGGAVCLWLLGSPKHAWGVLLPDGTRGEAESVDRLTGLGWRRPTADGRWVFGTVELAEGDAAFADAPAQPTAEVPEDDGRPNLEADMLRSHDVLAAVRDDGFAEALYAALCNVDWRRRDAVPPARWSCSWRYAGGVVADLRGKGEIYLDFYCSGNEGEVRDDVRELLARLGWHPLGEQEVAADRAWAAARIAELEAAPPAAMPDWYRGIATIGGREPVEPGRGALGDRIHHLAWSGRITREQWAELWEAVA